MLSNLNIHQVASVSISLGKEFRLIVKHVIGLVYAKIYSLKLIKWDKWRVLFVIEVAYIKYKYNIYNRIN